MGFDFEIHLSLGMCQETGRPYYYSKREGSLFEKVYYLSDILVPKEHRSSFQLRGKMLHAYTEYFNEQSVYTTSVSRFLEQFPDWDTVKEFLEERDITYWTEQEHNAFYNALVWCEKSPYYFMVDWSY